MDDPATNAKLMGRPKVSVAMGEVHTSDTNLVRVRAAHGPKEARYPLYP